MRRKIRVGRVISDKMDKTIIVAVEWRRAHPIYKKAVRRRTRFRAHDEQNTCRIGDLVRIVETRPLSKTKRWRLEEILSRQEIAEVQPEDITIDEDVLTAVTRRPEDEAETAVTDEVTTAEAAPEETEAPTAAVAAVEQEAVEEAEVEVVEEVETVAETEVEEVVEEAEVEEVVEEAEIVAEAEAEEVVEEVEAVAEAEGGEGSRRRGNCSGGRGGGGRGGS